MDLSKLTVAPWESGTLWMDCNLGQEDAEFIVLARAAFEVMMKRGWAPGRGNNGNWWVENVKGDLVLDQDYADPFTALVEVDAWYRENVEKADAVSG